MSASGPASARGQLLAITALIAAVKFRAGAGYLSNALLVLEKSRGLSVVTLRLAWASVVAVNVSGELLPALTC